MYSSPPRHGAAIAAEILQDPVLFAEWRVELKAMADRIHAMREVRFSRFSVCGFTDGVSMSVVSPMLCRAERRVHAMRAVRSSCFFVSVLPPMSVPWGLELKAMADRILAMREVRFNCLQFVSCCPLGLLLGLSLGLLVSWLGFGLFLVGPCSVRFQSSQSRCSFRFLVATVPRLPRCCYTVSFPAPGRRAG